MRKILSIDAGGVRGIIPATILAEVEARTGQPVCSLFDFFAGTSSGGMLVLAPQMRAFLPRERYIRIQADPMSGLGRIDDASEQGPRALQKEARETISRNADDGAAWGRRGVESKDSSN